MRAVRQAAGGLVYGFISLLLVLGSLALAQAQGGVPVASAPTIKPLPSNTALLLSSPTTAPTAAQTAVTTGAAIPATVTPSAASPTSTKTITPAKPTVASQLACARPDGWVRAYVVEPGDTLYQIARLYAVSVESLQRANCRSTTLIYVGEHLWVPYSQAAATELTIIPTFPTPTEPGATATLDP